MIPKPDGQKRPIGIPAVEDKIVQGATAEVLNAIYEADFMGFSYGFRRGRSQHMALTALTVGITRKRVNWVLDADIRGFFDTIDHGWLVKFVEHRVADQRVVRHIKKWLHAGVLVDGEWTAEEEGTPQGGSISPLLANIYLHYALDLWVQHKRQTESRGETIIVRYADDFVMGFERRSDADGMLEELKRRLAKFNLALHPEKTRLMEFGRHAQSCRAKRGDPKPETFDFLGFTHCCSRTRRGYFTVHRRTMRKRMHAKLAKVKVELRKRRHDPIPEVGRWLGRVLNGHYQYYGVPGNYRALQNFLYQVIMRWRQVIRRRSQRSVLAWPKMSRILKRYLPTPTIRHPWPELRLRV
jgi:group II intron reverse transcriptase/maturase